MKFDLFNSWKAILLRPGDVEHLFALCFYVLGVAIFTIYVEDANYAEFGLLGFVLIVERRTKK